MSANQSGRDPQIRQDVQAGRDAYVAARDITVVHSCSPTDDQAQGTELARRRRLALQAGPRIINDPDELEEWCNLALAPWTSRDRFGDTFGPGYEYEHAIRVMGGVTAPEAYVQAVAERLADVITEAVQENRVSYDDYDAALGLDVATLRLRNIPRKARGRLFDKADESKEVLGGLATMDMKRLRAWYAGDAERRSFLVYYAVVVGRIGLR
jgi:hypothetical protein